jgi:serine/threonine protein kinase
VQLAWPTERAVGIHAAIRSRRLMPLLVAWVAEGCRCAATAVQKQPQNLFLLDPVVCVHTRAVPAEINEIESISRGATAAVEKATWREQPVAVKNFEIPIAVPSMDSRDWEEGYQLRGAWREIVVASMMCHPNLTPCLAAVLPCDSGSARGTVCATVVMPLMGPDLRTVLNDTPDALSDNDRLNVLLQVAYGIEHLHSCGVVHRDVKSLNVLLSQESGWVAQLTDFGSCRPLWTSDPSPPPQVQMTAGIGTTAWMAPELFSGTPYGKEVDVFSLGIVMWECLTSKSPFADRSNFEIPARVLKGERPAMPADPSRFKGTAFFDLLAACWERKPKKRPTIESVSSSLRSLVAQTS